MFLLISSQHILAQRGHYQVILEEYTYSGGVHISYNAYIKFGLVNVESDLNNIYQSDFKF
jgi:hypothetical protein